MKTKRTVTRRYNPRAQLLTIEAQLRTVQEIQQLQAKQLHEAVCSIASAAPPPRHLLTMTGQEARNLRDFFRQLQEDDYDVSLPANLAGIYDSLQRDVR